MLPDPMQAQINPAAWEAVQRMFAPYLERWAPPVNVQELTDTTAPPAPYDGSQRRRRYWKRVTER